MTIKYYWYLTLFLLSLSCKKTTSEHIEVDNTTTNIKDAVVISIEETPTEEDTSI